ncbi:hypothetical protein Tco_1030196 [Tanacetum coccineum]|uniref:Uncharacterized protein n=1 Tax=Tanacetum coccineum TaxID=301880 RepID=A0ABQ5G5J2_9ASTR
MHHGLNCLSVLYINLFVYELYVTNLSRIISSITAQQTKLDLELVPKENRIDIGKCNGRIRRGLTPREPTFQVVLDAIALTPCYPAFLITADVPEILVILGISLHSMMLLSIRCMTWRTFAALFNRSLSGKTSGLDKLRLSKAQIICEASQIYGAVLPECLTSLEMKESKAYKTYLGYATGSVLKIAENLRKPLPLRRTVIWCPVDKEPGTEQGKRVKRSAKKPSTTPAAGVLLKPQSTFKAVFLHLTEFDLKKILLDKMEKRHQSSRLTRLRLPLDQVGNLGDNEDEPRKETASRRDWFKKPTPPQEPTDPDWNIVKTTQEGPTQNWFNDSADSLYLDNH